MKHPEYKETITSYDRNPAYHRGKFDKVGIRKEDVDRAFSLVSRENPSCVELGCGSGRDAAYILAKTPNYKGIDASEGLLNIARKEVSHGTFILADMLDVEFEPQSIDIIFAFASLLHMKPADVEIMLDKGHKWLAKGGIFYISVKNGTGESKKVDPDGVRHFYYYTEDDFRKMLGSHYAIAYSSSYVLMDVSWLVVGLMKI